eukprot:m.123866 g.123866  ORF g.123866 m.123866 type:complete len:1200 (+) comp13762_c0_seq4:144-3743(+)
MSSGVDSRGLPLPRRKRPSASTSTPSATQNGTAPQTPQTPTPAKAVTVTPSTTTTPQSPLTPTGKSQPPPIPKTRPTLAPKAKPPVSPRTSSLKGMSAPSSASNGSSLLSPSLSSPLPIPRTSSAATPQRPAPAPSTPSTKGTPRIPARPTPTTLSGLAPSKAAAPRVTSKPSPSPSPRPSVPKRGISQQKHKPPVPKRTSSSSSSISSSQPPSPTKDQPPSARDHQALQQVTPPLPSPAPQPTIAAVVPEIVPEPVQHEPTAPPQVSTQPQPPPQASTRANVQASLPKAQAPPPPSTSQVPLDPFVEQDDDDDDDAWGVLDVDAAISTPRSAPRAPKYDEYIELQPQPETEEEPRVSAAEKEQQGSQQIGMVLTSQVTSSVKASLTPSNGVQQGNSGSDDDSVGVVTYSADGPSLEPMPSLPFQPVTLSAEPSPQRSPQPIVPPPPPPPPPTAPAAAVAGVNTIAPPPPPPPPPPMPQVLSPPSPQPAPASATTTPPSFAGNSLAAALQAGRQQLVTAEPQLPESPSSHSQLLSAIQGGIQLRHTEVQERPRAMDPLDELSIKLRSKQRQRAEEGLDDATVHAMTQLHDQLCRISALTSLPLSRDALARITEEAKQIEEKVDRAVIRVRFPNWHSELIDNLVIVQTAISTVQAAQSSLEDFLLQTERDANVVNVELLCTLLSRVSSAYFSLFVSHSTIQSVAIARIPLSSDIRTQSSSGCASAVERGLRALFHRANYVLDSASAPGIKAFDQQSRVASAHRLFKSYRQLSAQCAEQLEMEHLAESEEYAQAAQILQEAQNQFGAAIAVRERKGQWDKKETVELSKRPAVKPKVRVPTEPGVLAAVIEAIKSSAQVTAEVSSALENYFSAVDVQNVAANFVTLVKTAIAADNMEALKALLMHPRAPTRESLADRDSTYFYHATIAGHLNALEVMLEAGMDINAVASDSLFTALHFAARRNDRKTMAWLVDHGADPTLRNGFHKTPLELLGIKFGQDMTISAASAPSSLPVATHQGFIKYLMSSTFSDVILVLDCGTKIPAHKIMLCATSSFFSAQLDGEWRSESLGDTQQLPVSDVSAKAMKLVLEFMYCGECQYPLDDLNLCLEVMMAASLLLLPVLRETLELHIGTKLSVDNVLDVYQYAYHGQAPKLLSTCTFFILNHYPQLQVHSTAADTLKHILSELEPRDLDTASDISRVGSV